MPVMLRPASVNRTCTYVYATTMDEADSRPIHVCGYQNEARSWSGRNVMFLNFAGSNLSLVEGVQNTETLMVDVTRRLSDLVPQKRSRVGVFNYTHLPRGRRLENYGTYTVTVAQTPADILPALEQVPEHQRPDLDKDLERMVDFYAAVKPRDSFVLACFDDRVKPAYPITVSYVPHNPQMLTIPGLDGCSDRLPSPGNPVRRDSRIAFALGGGAMPHIVEYQDEVGEAPWAPDSVCGFVDNRSDGQNGDYVVSAEIVRAGITGRALAAELRETWGAA